MREKALIWKQDRKIVPLCAAIYLLCYLDRSNIGEYDILRKVCVWEGWRGGEKFWIEGEY